MNLKRLFNLNGIKYLYLASVIALNVFWVVGLAVFLSNLIMKDIQSPVMVIQGGMMVAAFVGPFVAGWLVGEMAADGRGPIYGWYGGLASAVMLLVLAVPTTGLLGVMLMIAALSGGLNGGFMTVRRK